MDMTHISAFWYKLPRKDIQLKANKYLPRIIFAVLLLLLIQTFAELTWRIFTPAEKIVLSVNNKTASLNARNSIKSSNLDEVSQYHLFGNAKKRVTTTQAIISAPDTRLRLDLKGVFASNKASQALAIISSNKGKDTTYHIGDKVKGGVLLHAVYTDRVILKRNGKLETLRLPKPKVNSQSFYSKSPSRVAAPISTNTQQNNASRLRQLRSTLLNEPGKLWQQVRISPVMKNGKIKGYTLSHNDQALMKALNIRSSDIITSVNGQSLSEPSTLYGLMNSLSEQKSLLLDIERNGQPQTVELTF